MQDLLDKINREHRDDPPHKGSIQTKIVKVVYTDTNNKTAYVFTDPRLLPFDYFCYKGYLSPHDWEDKYVKIKYTKSPGISSKPRIYSIEYIDNIEYDDKISGEDLLLQIKHLTSQIEKFIEQEARKDEEIFRLHEKIKELEIGLK